MGRGKPKPTKPEIKPSKKLKAYQWRRILKEPKDKKNRKHLVWDDIEEVDLDMQEVEDLFEDKKKAKPASSSPSKAKKVNTKKKFFDGDTSQKMCIILKRMPKPHVTCEILTNLDDKFTEKIQPSIINGILRAWPEDSEVQALEEEYAANPDEQWDFAEEYVISLKDIKAIKLKCQVIKFCLEYAEQEEFFLEPLEKFEAAFKELSESKILKDSLAVILSLGNILNGGHKTRGQADGFQIEGMIKIITIKDANNRSGMEFVCKKLLEIDSEYANFKKNLRGLYDAKRNNLPELMGMFEGYINQTSGAKNKCDAVTKNKDDPSSYVYETIVKKKIESYEVKLKEMLERYKKCDEQWKEIGEYYGIKKDDEKMEDTTKFFSFWIQYFDGIDKHWPKESKNKKKSSSPTVKKPMDNKMPNKPMRMLPLE